MSRDSEEDVRVKAQVQAAELCKQEVAFHSQGC